MHDAWLVKFESDADDASVVASAHDAARLQRHRLARVGAHRALAGPDVYVYLELAASTAIDDDERAAFASLLPSATVSRLMRNLAPPAASANEGARNFYVVETEVAPGWEAELTRWYDNEHMLGLASVPGCVRAQRYVNVDTQPWSHACYDLVSAKTTSSIAWLAVRQTEWSDRVRPQFRNTKRTMFRILT